MGNQSIAQWAEEFYRSHGPISGGDHSEENDTDDEDDDSEEEDEKGKKKSGGGTGTDNKSGQTLTFTSSAFKNRLKRERAAMKEDIEAEIRKELELKKAEDDKDLQKLLDIARPRAAEAEGLEKIVDQFIEAAEARWEREFPKLPKSIQLLAPDEDSDILEREKWLYEKALPALDEINKRKKKSADDDDEEDDEDEEKERKTAARGSNFKDPKAKKTQDKQRKAILDRLSTTSNYRKA